jgi:hypothetical protein
MEFTVASFNLQRFFDTVNDPGIGEPVLTATAFANRLNKASLAIRDFTKAPDILGVVEVENLSTLQALAAKISADAVAAAQPDPLYQCVPGEGNDDRRIDDSASCDAAGRVTHHARVTVGSVVQENAGELFTNPDSSTELLNDRPTLRLMATVNHPNGAVVPDHGDGEPPALARRRRRHTPAATAGRRTGAPSRRNRRRAQAESVPAHDLCRRASWPTVRALSCWSATSTRSSSTTATWTRWAPSAGTPTPRQQVVLRAPTS